MTLLPLLDPGLRQALWRELSHQAVHPTYSGVGDQLWNFLALSIEEVKWEVKGKVNTMMEWDE